MTIPEFMKLFDKKALEEARVSFTIHAGLDRGGKWTLWCDKGETADGFIKYVESNDCLNDLDVNDLYDIGIDPQGDGSVKFVMSFE